MIYTAGPSSLLPSHPIHSVPPKRAVYILAAAASAVAAAAAAAATATALLVTSYFSVLKYCTRYCLLEALVVLVTAVVGGASSDAVVGGADQGGAYRQYRATRKIMPGNMIPHEHTISAGMNFGACFSRLRSHT